MGMDRNPSKTETAQLVMIIAVLACLVLATEAATYTVGGRAGWSYGVNNWPTDKTFRAGDELVFNYDKTVHHLVKVNKRAYESCDLSAKDVRSVYKSGNDKVKLVRGPNYFVCSNIEHCQAGMKVAVNAI